MKKAFVIIVSLLLCLAAYAQDGNRQLLDKLVEKKVLSQDEANAIILESKTTPKTNDGIEKVRHLFNNRYLQLSGYGMLKYEYDSNVQGSQSRHDFRPRVVYLTIAGEVNDKLRYSVLFDFADPRLHELWAEWTASERFNLKIGQFKNPLSFENQFAPGNLEYGMFSRPTVHLMGHAKDIISQQPNATKNSIGRDLGIQASGTAIKLNERKFLDYAVGVFQGSGINAKDPDNTKDFAGMLTLYPIKGLRLGGGAHFGQATFEGENAEKTSHVRNRYVASAEYAYDRFKARTEYMRGNDAGITSDGLYGMAMYSLIPKKFDVLGKVSYFNRNIKTSAEVMDYTVGLNYNIFTLTRLQLNYTYSDFTNQWGTAYNSNHNVLVHVQVGF